MTKERIHVYLSREMIQTVQTLMQRPGEFSAQVEDLLQRGLSLKKGEVIEQQSLPIIREIVQGELLKAHAQLRSDLREDRKMEKQDVSRELKENERRLGDRLAALIIRALREGLISRRMLYALLAKEDPDFAVAAFEDAKTKAGRDIGAKVSDPVA